MLDPVVYYAKVGASFLGQVAKHELQVPDIGKATQGLSKMVETFTSQAWRKVTLGEVGAYAKEGVKIGGFFLVGEMIGRGSVIGYKIEGAESHGHH